MKYHFRTLFGSLSLAWSVIHYGAAVEVSVVHEQSAPGTSSPQTSLLASEAYSVLSELPKVGIDQSKGKIDRLIALSNKLLSMNGSHETQLFLALREAIAHGLVYELCRSEALRLGVSSDERSDLVPFNKKNFLDLWNANLLNDAKLLNRTFRGNGMIVDMLSSNGVDDSDIVAGTWLGQMPLEQRDLFTKLKQHAKDYMLQGKKLSPDELFVQSIVVLQYLQDLDAVVRVYEKSGLLKDRSDFSAAIDVALQNTPKKRMDDGMRASPLKVLSTFSKFCSSSEDGYFIKQALLLGPYMDNTDVLPAQIQAHLGQQKIDEE